MTIKKSTVVWKNPSIEDNNRIEDNSQGQKSLPCWADILGKHFILSLFPLQLKITNIAILI